MMEGVALKEGKERVTVHLIAPLEKAGMRRKGSVTMAVHQDFLNRVRARLAYMDADRLAALCEVVEVHAGGKARDIWPSEIMIMNWARRIQTPPPSESRLVRSYLQSAAGSAARDRGCLVELFWWLRKYGAPPNDFAWTQIETEARENSGRRARLQREAAHGTVSPSDAAWVKAYWDTHDRCTAICGDVIEQEGAAA